MSTGESVGHHWGGEGLPGFEACLSSWIDCN